MKQLKISQVLKDMDIQIQKVPRTSSKLRQKRTSPRHSVVQLPEVKNRENPGDQTRHSRNPAGQKILKVLEETASGQQYYIQCSSPLNETLGQEPHSGTGS